MRYRYAPFLTWLIVVTVAAGIGSWIRGCAIIDRDAQIEAHASEIRVHVRDRNAIMQLEGRKPGTPLHAVAEQVRRIADDPKAGKPTLAEIVDLAQRVQGMDGKQLERLGTMDRWLPYKTLASLPGFGALIGHGVSHDLSQAIFGKRDLSTRLKPPEDPPPRIAFFDGFGVGDGMTLWLAVYLIACMSFVVLWSFLVLMDHDDPLRDVRWRHPAAFVTFVTAAPGTVPAAALYGLCYLVYRIFRDGERFWGAVGARSVRIARTCLRAGYRLRLLRRLPPPVLAPLPTSTPAAAPTGAPSPAPERRRPEAHDWVVVDPRVTIGRKHRLEARGIHLYPIELRSPEAMIGQAVPEPQIAEFEDELCLTEVSREDDVTDIEGVRYRWYEYASGDVTIVGLHPDSGLGDALEEALEEASADADRADIVFYATGGRVTEPRSTGEGWIVHAYAVPEASEIQYHHRLFGSDLGVSRRVFKPSGHGVVIRDPDGLAVAQVVGRNVYLLIDLLGIEGPRLKTAFMQECLVRILTEAFDARGSLSDAEDGRLRGLLEAEKSEHRRRYVEISRQRDERRKKELVSGIAACDREVGEAGQAITQGLLRRKQLARRLEALETGEACREEAERLGLEFDALAASKVVVAVRAYQDRVEVDTTTVRIRHGARTYLIGRFRIVMRADGTLEIRNIENAGRDRDAHHPHVTNYACLGNISEPIAKYLAAREYTTVVSLLYRFLGSYNPQSPLVRIDKWPTVKE